MTDRRLESAAVTLAERGYFVFPCKPRGKEPLTKNGWKDATRDERSILHRWDKWPDANIGVACGPSGIAVLDIDAKAGADPREVMADLGLDAYAAVWTGEAPERSPEFPGSLAGVRGAHVLFRGALPTGKTKIPGVEVRSAGAYVIAPPSVHPSGVPYQGEFPPVASLPPEPGLEFILANGGTPADVPGDDDVVEQGERHEALLAWARSRFTAKGVLGRPALDAMMGHNARALRPPLPAQEVERLWKHLEGTRIAASERAGRAVPASDVRVAVSILGSSVRIRPVRYLWRPWLPLGKVTILAGAPGQGKSQLAAFMAAATTTAAFAEGDVTAPGNVVILTAEDDLADTVAPRLLACGADMGRWEAIVMRRTMPHGVTADGLIKLPGDLDTLHARLHAGDVRLVVFDPVASFVGRDHSTYVNQDVRDVLDPVVALAAHYGVAVVLVMHLNKGEGKTWASKIGESHAFQAIARTVVAVAPDPDDEDGDDGVDKIMAPTKLNLVRRERGLALKYRLTATTVYGDDLTPVATSMVAFTGRSSIAADDLLSDQVERGARRDTLDFLVDVLAAGPMESKPLQAAAKKVGVSWRSVQRYYREVCKSAKPATSQGPWVYDLQDRHFPTHTPGAYGGYGDDEDPKSANYARGMSREVADMGVAYNGADPTGEHGAHSAADLDAYRRQRDAMLGERWDDDDA